MLLWICLISNRKLFQWSLYCGNIPGSVCLWNPCVGGVCVGAYSGVEPPSFIHGQESVTVDTFDANDPLRNCKELQDTWVDKQHALMMDGWSRCIFTSHDICSISSLQMTSVVSRWLHCSALKRHNTNYSKSVLKIIALLWPSELGSLFNRCFWLPCLMLHGGKNCSHWCGKNISSLVNLTLLVGLTAAEVKEEGPPSAGWNAQRLAGVGR